MQHDEFFFVPGANASLFVVILSIFGLKLLPYCPVSSKPPLHPHAGLVLSHAVVCLDHCSGQHPRHLQVSDERLDNENPIPKHRFISITHTLNCIVKPL